MTFGSSKPPGKAPKVCQEPGCPVLTGETRCSAHQRARQNAEAPFYRNAGKQKVYNSRRWRAMRRTQLARVAWCEVPGCVNAAMEVDHIINFRDGRDPRAWDAANLQSLCKAHHSAKTLAEAYGRKVPGMSGVSGEGA